MKPLRYSLRFALVALLLAPIFALTGCDGADPTSPDPGAPARTPTEIRFSASGGPVSAIGDEATITATVYDQHGQAFAELPSGTRPDVADLRRRGGHRGPRDACVPWAPAAPK